MFDEMVLNTTNKIHGDEGASKIPWHVFFLILEFTKPVLAHWTSPKQAQLNAFSRDLRQNC